MDKVIVNLCREYDGTPYVEVQGIKLNHIHFAYCNGRKDAVRIVNWFKRHHKNVVLDDTLYPDCPWTYFD